MTESTHTTPTTLHLVSTGDDDTRLDRMEHGFIRMLQHVVDVKPLRLGHVTSLRLAYHNAARLIGDKNALLMFVHQDVEPVSDSILEKIPVQQRQQLRPLIHSGPEGPLWWQSLCTLLNDESFGIAGVAGSCDLQPGRAWWQHDRLSGMVMHRREEGVRINAYGRWSRVVTVDGMCMLCKVKTLLNDPPNPAESAHFHFYDHDICLSAHKRGLSNWTLPLLLLHDSGGAATTDAQWQTDQVWFEQKHADQLPVSIEPGPLPGLGA